MHVGYTFAEAVVMKAALQYQF